MAKAISATKAAREFSDLLARVRYRGEEFVIEKGGKPMCQVLPVRSAVSGSTAADLALTVGKFTKPDPDYLKAVERVARRQPRAPKSPWRR